MNFNGFDNEQPNTQEVFSRLFGDHPLNIGKSLNEIDQNDPLGLMLMEYISQNRQNIFENQFNDIGLL